MADNDNGNGTPRGHIHGSANNSATNQSTASHQSYGSHQSNQSNQNALLKIKEEMEVEHAKRVTDWRARATAAEEQSKALRDYIQHKVVIENIGNKEQLISYGYQLKCREEYSEVSQANTLYCQLLMFNNQLINKQRIPCRLYTIDQISEPFRTQLLTEGLKIWKYFSRSEKVSQFWLKLYEMLKADNFLYVFHDRINPNNSLRHRVWNGESISGQVKNWVIQLSEAIDILHTAGVAHRFIRLENILVGSDQRVKLTCFDLACLFWNVDDRQPIIQSRGLPSEINKTLWNHLPPECFEDDGYDASMVDVWSVGAVICELLTKNIPMDFEAVSQTDPIITGLIQQWTQSTERKIVLEEYRTLLDDIFNEFDKRMTIFDLKNDKRLRYQSSVFCKVKMEPFYRIDVHKNLNLIEPKIHRTKSILPKVVPATNFSKSSIEIFNLVSYKTIQNEESMQTMGYQILRNVSFGPEFQLFKNDFYLKASIREDANYLCKIFVLSRIPIRHRNMLLNESTKIMRYFSNYQKTPQTIHRVMEIFLSEGKLYLFMENLLNYRTMDMMVRGYFKCQVKDTVLLQWMTQLSEVIHFLNYHGISHRYIRPEYVFIVDNEGMEIKLTHFDMSCFVWNPARSVEVLRHRCLQDEQTHIWDHLAPECFNEKYDSLLVDVWSFGVLVVYCITVNNPFTVPFRMDCESEPSNSNSKKDGHRSSSPWSMWRQFRGGRFKNKLATYLEMLDQIFTNFDQRIHTGPLMKRFNAQGADVQSAISSSSGGSSQTNSKNNKKAKPKSKANRSAVQCQSTSSSTRPGSNNANSSTMFMESNAHYGQSRSNVPSAQQSEQTESELEEEEEVVASSDGQPQSRQTRRSLGKSKKSSSKKCKKRGKSNGGFSSNVSTSPISSSHTSSSTSRGKHITAPKGTISSTSKALVGKLSNSIMQLFGNRKVAKKS